jgi:hypothetical protein
MTGGGHSGGGPVRARPTAVAGNTMPESTPAPTSAAAFAGSIDPEARQQASHDRSQRGDERDDGEVDQLLLERHKRTYLPQTTR